MPPLIKKVSHERFNFKKSLSWLEIRRLRKDGGLKVLQTDEPVDKKTLVRLNESFFSKRPDVEFRLYGFYSTECSLEFLSSMTNIQRLSVDCLQQASGLESIAELQKLKQLRVGIRSLQNFNFLENVSDEIETLTLGATKSKKPDLAALSRLRNLKTIYLEGQKKNIEVLSDLKQLQDITLRSISLPNLDLLKPLLNLHCLDIKLGGTRNLAAIEDMKQLKYLELWQVMGLADVSVVSTLTGLQHLFLQSLPKVTELPDFGSMLKLRRITLETMKGLVDVTSLKHAPALTEFIHIAANNLQPQDYLPLLENKSVKDIRIGFGSHRKNAAFRELMTRYNKSYLEFSRFDFVD